MASLISRSLVLATARLLSQAVLMLSPILIVRLLDVLQYGRYRQFTITATFLAALASFSIASNINYFVSRSRQQAPVYVTNSCLFLLITSGLVSIVVWLARPWIVPDEISGYWLLLALYIPLHVNVDIVTSYWLATARSDLVLFYSVGQAILRLGTIVAVAAMTHDVGAIVAAMVTVEALRTIAVFVGLSRVGLLTRSWNREVAREQIRFIFPHGTGALLYNLNDNIPRLIVSGLLGPTSLAVYSIACYQAPIMTVVKSAISDVVFPDMVQRSLRDRREGLRLWQRGNVVSVILICPIWILLSYFAEPVIRLLFTEAYVSATPYFQALLLVMLRQCFDFSTPLRSIGRTSPFVTANVVGLVLNAGLSLLLLEDYGLWGPTLGTVTCQLWLMVYLGFVVSSLFDLRIGELLEWRKLAIVFGAGGLAFLALVSAQKLLDYGLIGVAIACGAFFAVYLLLLQISGLHEWKYVVSGILRQLGVHRPVHGE